MAFHVDGSSPAVALLQGGPGFGSGSVAPVAELLRHRFRVVHFDHVASILDGLLDGLENVRESLGEEHWFVLGHSWGAAVAAVYAATYLARTTGLVLAHPLEIASEFCNNVIAPQKVRRLEATSGSLSNTPRTSPRRFGKVCRRRIRT